jgi:hypothetical protein
VRSRELIGVHIALLAAAEKPARQKCQALPLGVS